MLLLFFSILLILLLSSGSRNPRSSPLVIDFAKDFDKNLVHNLSIFATNKPAGVGGPTGNGPSTAPLPLVPFYLPP